MLNADCPSSLDDRSENKKYLASMEKYALKACNINGKMMFSTDASCN